MRLRFGRMVGRCCCCWALARRGAALRRSELVQLTRGDITAVPVKELRMLIRRSKTDPRGLGQQVAICANTADPVCCLLVALQG